MGRTARTTSRSAVGGSFSSCYLACCCSDHHGGGLIPKQQLQNRFSLFSRGEWEQLLLQSEECVAVASKAFQRKRRTQTDTPERRADRAQFLVMMGEVSAGRQALEGAPLAPGTQRTLDELRDLVRRPTSAYVHCPRHSFNHHAERTISLDKTLFQKNLKRARRGAEAGPPGVTAEDMKSVLSESGDAERLFSVAVLLAQASVLQEVRTARRMGRLTALQKPNWSGNHGGKLFRRLVARTMAQQLGPAIERATSPFQYALSTRAGT